MALNPRVRLQAKPYSSPMIASSHHSHLCYRHSLLQVPHPSLFDQPRGQLPSSPRLATFKQVRPYCRRLVHIRGGLITAVLVLTSGIANYRVSSPPCQALGDELSRSDTTGDGETAGTA